jgi:hypothetical protein
MSTGGWLVMLLSCLGVTAWLAWCLWKVLATPGASEHIHAPPDLDPDQPK